jgi:hypothetical protein
MANKYLEKIASLASMAVEGTKSVGRIALKGTKAVGNQVHKSLGGGYQDYARTNLGVRDHNVLSKINGSKSGIHELNRAGMQALHKDLGTIGKTPTFKDKMRMARDLKKKLPELKKDQTDARMVTGVLGAGATYTGMKIKSKLDEPQVQTYNY